MAIFGAEYVSLENGYRRPAQYYHDPPIDAIVNVDYSIPPPDLIEGTDIIDDDYDPFWFMPKSIEMIDFYD